MFYIHNCFWSYIDNIPKQIETKIDGNVLQRVDSCKYLGIYFDCHRKWEKLIEHVVIKNKYVQCKNQENVMQATNLLFI